MSILQRLLSKATAGGGGVLRASDCGRAHSDTKLLEQHYTQLHTIFEVSASTQVLQTLNYKHECYKHWGNYFAVVNCQIDL